MRKLDPTSPSSKLIERHSAIEDVLDQWTDALGTARAAYGGHAYRVFNYARRILGGDARDDELAIASAFHDIGIWTDHTFDYLAPSIDRARMYLEREGKPTAVVAALIENHHRLRRANDEVVEAFRRADLVDVSRGIVRASVDRGFVRELVGVFPYAGFHGVLVRTALAWFVRHPLRPFPMMRY